LWSRSQPERFMATVYLIGMDGSLSHLEFSLRRARLVLVALLSSVSVVSAQSSARLDTAQVRQWREDLAFLRQEMPARHVNLFHDMTRVQFDSALTSIDARLPNLARHQVIVELQKLAALIGDGHSTVGPWRDSVIAFHSLPVALYWFSDGISVRAADSTHADLIGARVVAIGELPIEAAIARVRPLISHDNEMGVRAYAPLFLTMPEILQATGVIVDMQHASYVVEKDGKRRTVTLGPSGLFPMLTGDIDKNWLRRPGWVDARDRAPSALWLSDPMNPYWFKYLGEQRTLYCQINTIQQKPTDPLPAFMVRAIAAADSAGADRFVLDLRLNEGGDGGYNPLIFLPLIKSRYDESGRLYVITGRHTFSAAQMLVTEMEKYTTAIFVGEPTSSHGNHFGDSYRIVLPNSRVTVRVSTLWHQYLGTRDKRVMVEPQISSPITFGDYAAGRDPALEAALHAARRADREVRR
jgi:hypothetical protein